MRANDCWFLGALSIVVAAVLAGRSGFVGGPAAGGPPAGAPPGVPPPAAVLTVHYHERAPYYVTAGEEVRGLCADPLREALADAGVEARWVRTPPKRQLRIVEADTGRDCILGWFRTPERERLGRFSAPLYQDRSAIALARADDPRVPTGGSVGALLGRRDLVLLRKDGYSYGAFLDDRIARHAPPAEVADTDNVGMMRMLAAGRGDYFFLAEEEADALLGEAPGGSAAFRYVRFTDMPAGNRRYLLCSRQVEERVLERIDLALEARASQEPR